MSNIVNLQINFHQDVWSCLLIPDTYSFSTNFLQSVLKVFSKNRSWSCQHKFVQNDHQLLDPKNYSVLKKPQFEHFLAKIFQTFFSPNSLFRGFCSKIEFLPKNNLYIQICKKDLQHRSCRCCCWQCFCKWFDRPNSKCVHIRQVAGFSRQPRQWCCCGSGVSRWQ